MDKTTDILISNDFHELVEIINPEACSRQLGVHNLRMIADAANTPTTSVPAIAELRSSVDDALNQNGLRYPEACNASLFQLKQVGALTCSVYQAKVPAQVPTLVMFFGGGFCLNTLAAHKAFMVQVAQLLNFQCNLILPHIPLSPEVKADVITASCEDCLVTLLAHTSDLGFSEELMVMGWSSGAHLALTAVLNLLETSKTELVSKIQSLWLFSPWMDLSLRVSRIGPFQKQQALDKTAAGPDVLAMLAEAYCVENTKLDDEGYTPLFRDKHVLQQLPLTRVICGACDVLFGDAALTTYVLKHADVSVAWHILNGQTHNYMVFDNLSKDGVSAAVLTASLIQKNNVDDLKGNDGLGLLVRRYNSKRIAGNK